MRATGLGLILIVPLLAAPFADETLIARVAGKYGKFAKNRFVYLNETLEKLRGKSDREKLKGVNDFFNEVRYAPDLKVYRQKDYWATPWEFLGHDMGDCEDYVIAKYFALKHLGIDPKKLFFTYVKSRRFKEPHMVLTYFETPGSVPLVLDNTNFKIFPADKRRDLIPIYNFNGDSLYLARKKGLGKEVTTHKSHKKWDQLLINIQRKKI
jgi:predicted transglutaminase-like cysteine proteinase